MTGSEDDYWTNLPGPEGPEESGAVPALTVETIEGVEPLDAQFGVAAPLTVPPALREALFGQPEIIAGCSVLPLHTYAVLDAAKVQGLPEMLESSGLDHACLFQGTAAEDLRDVAPWIVRLEDGNRFTQGLFTRGDAPWEMWDAEAGIFLRSISSLNEVRRHLRKFTKVRDETGKWFYFRFWEPETSEAYLRLAGERAHLTVKMFRLGASGSVLQYAVIQADGRCSVYTAQPGSGDVTSTPFEMTAEERRCLVDAHKAVVLRRIASRILLHRPDVPADELLNIVRETERHFGSMGFRQEASLFRLAWWQLHHGKGFEAALPSRLRDLILDRSRGEDLKLLDMSRAIDP